MELSIGILVYQIDPSPLVHEILAQASKANFSHEILIFDDGSHPDHQSLLREKFDATEAVTLHLNSHNRGRAGARNDLAQLAQGEYLLMIDGDAQIDDAKFLSKYWQARCSMGVTVGGKKLATKQAEKGCELRFKYAQEREILSLGKRIEAQFKSFQTNCFLIDTKVFKHISFDESLKGYGHEDSLFGLCLKLIGFKIEVIDNPTLYPAQEESAVFLKKTAEAIDNLLFIDRHYPKFRKEFPLLVLRARLYQWGLASLVKRILKGLAPYLQRNLSSAKPNLMYFDLFRLSLLLERNSSYELS